MSAVAAVVYILCFLASMICGWLLVRSYLINRAPFLLWSAVCFVLLATNNFFVVADILLFTDIDFGIWRTVTHLAAVVTLLYGLVWELD